MKRGFLAFVMASCFIVLFGAFEVSCNSDNGAIKFKSPFSAIDASPAGTFRGTFTSPAGETLLSEAVVAIISEDDDLQIMFSVGAERHYAGTVEVFGTNLEAALIEYLGAVGRFFGVGGISQVTLDATVAEADHIAGDYSAATDQGRFALDYLAIYDNGSSLESTAGVWTFNTMSAGGTGYTVTWDIDNSGLVFGVDTLGCVFTGRVSIIDSRFNAYRVVADVTSCGRFNGEYTGLAFLESMDGPDLNWMTLSVSNEVFAFATVLQK